MNIFALGAAVVAGLGLANVGTAAAQTPDRPKIGGRVLSGPVFDNNHMLLFSHSDFNLGTARSAAMGGAFTSLGADLSSININPAGLGMYRSSEWGVTLGLSASGSHTAAPNMVAGKFASGGSRVAFGANNVGAALNIFNGSGRLTSMSFGFSYNRMADFNSRSTISTTGEDVSVGEAFADQLTYMRDAGGPGWQDLGDSSYPFGRQDDKGLFKTEWSAVLGYQSQIVGLDENEDYGVLNDVVPSDSRFTSTTRGGISEWALSVGGNMRNVFYWGVTLGASHINYREQNTYHEAWSKAASPGMDYDYSTRISGAGPTVKLGVVVRPVPQLRIGVAFHTPTAYSVDRHYTSRMERIGKAWASASVDDKVHFTSSPRLLAGVSGIISGRAIVTVDYEATFHGAIRGRDMEQADLDYIKTEVGLNYGAGQALRAGVEVVATENVSLRVGGGYKWDYLKNRSYTAKTVLSPVRGYNVTAGVGFKVWRRGYVDVAYVFGRMKYTDYDLFYFDNHTGDTKSQYDMVGGRPVARRYDPSRSQHMVSVTFGSRF